MNNQKKTIKYKKTRISLFYLVGYLVIIGFGLLCYPNTVLGFFKSTLLHSEMAFRMVGMLMAGLGIAILGLIKLKVYAIYPTTLLVRMFFIICLTIFYTMSKDPFFGKLIIIVGIGFLLTLAGYLWDLKIVKSHKQYPYTL